MARGGGDARMFQFSLTVLKASGNLPERVGPAQLVIEHSHKLAPAGQSSGISLGFRLFNGLEKLGFWKFGWLEYKKRGIVCQEKSTPRYGSVFLIYSSASPLPSLERSVKAIAEEANALKNEENRILNDIHGLLISSHQNASGNPGVRRRNQPMIFILFQSIWVQCRGVFFA